MGDKQSRVESGFTLVEILAAITIMAIIIFSLLPIFPQLITWAKASERQLVSSNLLTKVIEDAQKDGDVKNGILALSPVMCNETTFNAYTEVPQATLDLLPAYEMNGNAYNAKLAICKTNANENGLLKLRVKLLSTEGKELITSYAYIIN